MGPQALGSVVGEVKMLYVTPPTEWAVTERIVDLGRPLKGLESLVGGENETCS
jgi:hypothetical protein